MPTDSPRAATLPQAPFLSKRIKLALALLGVAIVGLLVWLFLREAQKERRLEQWDHYGKLREDNEDMERFFTGEAPLYQAMRDRYVKDLEAFVARITEETPTDALEPQARWRIVRTVGESLVSLKDVLDVSKRLPHTERALRHLEVIQAKFPDFPLNWGQSFAPPGFGSTTKRLIFWFRENAAWERDHLPKAAEPDAGLTVVFRTERGDLRMGLYSQHAPTATARLVAAVQRGEYDGTCFVQRVTTSDAGETTTDALRAGDARSRGARPYEKQDALRFAKPDEREGLVPDETRNRVLHVRGVVTTWHPEEEPYDHPLQLLFVVRNSPALDYENTPLGRLVDEASLATLDRIHGSSTWRDDPLVSGAVGEERNLVDVLRAPVPIVKALIYQDGRLWAGEATALPSRIAADASEQTLAGLVPDAYKKDAPPPPAAPVPEPAPAPAPAPPAESVPPGGEPSTPK